MWWDDDEMSKRDGWIAIMFILNHDAMPLRCNCHHHQITQKQKKTKKKRVKWPLSALMVTEHSSIPNLHVFSLFFFLIFHNNFTLWEWIVVEVVVICNAISCYVNSFVDYYECEWMHLSFSCWIYERMMMMMKRMYIAFFDDLTVCNKELRRIVSFFFFTLHFTV